MIPISIEELADRLGGTCRQSSTLDPQTSPLLVSGFATDSRDVEPGDLFIAIRGAQVDGHAFVESALERGAVAALVERPVSGPHIQVYSIVAALARMARSFRDEFNGPVIGITGSAGKSSCKEFLASALTPLGRVLKPEGNRNTEYTAPLMWAELKVEGRGRRDEGGDLGDRPSTLNLRPFASVVVEMGMRGLGQIAHLASFSKPTIAVITNIGVSHLSALGSREAIARAKAEILEALPEDGIAILWAEDDYLDLLKEFLFPTPQPPPRDTNHSQRGGARKLLTFGFSESADARIVSYRATGWESSEIEIAFEGSVYAATLPVVGRHQALNAAAAFLAAVSAGVSPVLAAQGLANVKLPPMRMSIRKQGDVTFVLDMYNASPPSVIAALETVRDVLGADGMGPSTLDPRPSHLIAVLGEMRELGEHTEQGHRDVGEALVRFGVDRAILLAPAVDPRPSTLDIHGAAIAAGMPASKVDVASSHEEVKTLLTALEGPAVVLVKGSRGVELERTLPEGVL